MGEEYHELIIRKTKALASNRLLLSNRTILRALEDIRNHVEIWIDAIEDNLENENSE